MPEYARCSVSRRGGELWRFLGAGPDQSAFFLKLGQRHADNRPAGQCPRGYRHRGGIDAYGKGFPHSCAIRVYFP